MNERIRELELQAAEGTVDPNGTFTAEEFNNFTKKFAALVAADEREACIYEIELHTPRLGHTSVGEIRSKKMIAAIRARGESE
jgi:hypothetical protein